MPTDYLVSGTDLTSIANAIRTVGNTNANLEFPNGFISAINAIGVDRPEAEENDVILIDFDGRILYSYTAAQFAQLEALPTLPVIKYSFLQQDGWNWTLSDAKAYVAKYKELVIGAQYTTPDGKSKVVIEVPRDCQWSISVGIPNIGTSSGNSITVDWGDGSTVTTETGLARNITKSYTHSYQKGTYVVTIDSSHADARPTDFRYRGYVKAVAVSKPSSTGNSAYTYPKGDYDIIFMTGFKGTVGKMAQYCYSPAFVYPRGFVNFTGNSNWFSGTAASQGVKYVSYPKEFVGAFYGYNYQNCSCLRRLTAPEESVLINACCFNGCESLYKLSIPSGVTTIATQAFKGCTGLRELHFYPTTPPTVDNADAFTNLSTSCIIYVPTGKLTDYTTASNYPDSTTYTYVEE